MKFLSNLKHFFWSLSQPKICRLSPPPPSVLIPFSWKMRNVLKRMKNQFSDFYFSSYRIITFIIIVLYLLSFKRLRTTWNFCRYNKKKQPNISLTNWDPAGAPDSNNLHWLSETLVFLVIMGDSIEGLPLNLSIR